jgi:hypothetical protein
LICLKFVEKKKIIYWLGGARQGEGRASENGIKGRAGRVFRGCRARVIPTHQEGE